MMKYSSKIKPKPSGGFSTGFLMGTFLGALGMFLFGTKTGGKVLKELAQETNKARNLAQKTSTQVKESVEQAKVKADLALKEAETKLEQAKDFAQKAKTQIKQEISSIKTKISPQKTPATQIAKKAAGKKRVVRRKPKKKVFTRSGKPLK